MGKDTIQLPKALSPRDIERMRIRTIPFEGAFGEAFGNPSRTGVWIMWGESGSGKTSMALLLAKELTKYGRVAYNSLEQGASLSMKQAIERHELTSLRGSRFVLLSEELDILSERLSRRQSPDFVIIDSLQYTGLDYRAYKRFKALHRNKLIIFVSHAEGIQPDGRTAHKVKYDAEMKIFVEGYRATSKGRYFGTPGAYYTIWEEGANEYWLNK